MMREGSFNWILLYTRLINAYFPSGTSGDERQSFKNVWLDEFHAYLNNLKKKIS
jgi:exodeoxyribonuclease-3